MKYCLVLQFPATKVDDFDALVKLESSIEDRIKAIADVDGHDFGSGEMNVFIFCEDPQKVFYECKNVVSEMNLLSNLRAAFRERHGNEYTNIWPLNSSRPFKIK